LFTIQFVPPISAHFSLTFRFGADGALAMSFCSYLLAHSYRPLFRILSHSLELARPAGQSCQSARTVRHNSTSNHPFSPFLSDDQLICLINHLRIAIVTVNHRRFIGSIVSHSFLHNQIVAYQTDLNMIANQLISN
jgi:hypothetical protein